MCSCFCFQLASNTKKLWDDNEAARVAPEAGGAKPAFLAGHGNPWTPREDTWGAAPSGGEYNTALLVKQFITARKVWGKVMFLHLCIILFTGGGFPHASQVT